MRLYLLLKVFESCGFQIGLVAHAANGRRFHHINCPYFQRKELSQGERNGHKYERAFNMGAFAYGSCISYGRNGGCNFKRNIGTQGKA